MQQVLSWRRKHFLLFEGGVIVILTASFVIWSEAFHGWETLNITLHDNRSAIYGTLASIFGALLGFVIATVAIILGFSTDDRLSIVRNGAYYSMMWQVFFGAIRWLGLATISALVGLILDREADPRRLITYVTLLTALFAIFRLIRCVWVLENIIFVITQPSKERAGKIV
jgi:hypothetical protein